MEIKAAEPKNIAADGAILMDNETGRVLWGKNIDKPLAMASTTKIMTAVIALENADLNDIVKVSSKAAAAPEVKMKLQTGEEIKLEYLMYALMLQSSNDAAVAIAEHIGGSVEDFCKMMTQKAESIGCKDTVFETPNGLDKGDHHSTAEDMAIIARYALRNETFRKIIQTPEINFKSNRTDYYVSNKDRLLREYVGAIGVKTGFTGKAGHCFVGAAERNGMTLISVVLASGWGNKGKEQKWKDTKSILNYGFENYKYYDIVDLGKTAGEIKVEKGRSERLKCRYEKSFGTILSSEEYGEIKIENNLPSVIEAPIKKGDKTGTANVILNGEKLAEINVIADENIERFDFFTVFTSILSVYAT